MLIDTITADVISCGVLVVDLSADNAFKFAHKSFFEYLVAAQAFHRMVRLPESGNTEIHQAVARVFATLTPTAMSPEMIQFSAQLLHSFLLEKGAPKTIREAFSILKTVGVRANSYHVMARLICRPVIWPLGVYFILFTHGIRSLFDSANNAKILYVLFEELRLKPNPFDMGKARFPLYRTTVPSITYDSRGPNRSQMPTR